LVPTLPNGKLLRTEGGVSDYHVTTVGRDAVPVGYRGYGFNGSPPMCPCLYIICRETRDADPPLDVA